MANELVQVNIPLGQAAWAAGLQVEQVRNWLKRGHVGLLFDSDRDDGGWRRFAFGDVVRLGLVGALVRAKLPVVGSTAIIDNSVADEIQRLASYKNTPRRAIVETLSTWVIYAAPTDSGWNAQVSRGEHDVPDLSQTPMFVVVQPGIVANQVLERLDNL